MGRRVGRVTLDKLKFQLDPENPAMTRLEEAHDDDPQASYAACYTSVFHGARPDYLLKVDPQGLKLRALASELGVSVRLYTLAAMIGHKKAAPDRRFFATMLLGTVAPRRVEMYRSAASKMFGAFDAHSLEALTGGDEELLELKRKLRDSELTAAAWIVARKIRWAGDPCKELFANKEIALDPLWLAIEPAYRKYIFDPYIKEREGSKAQVAHRVRVAQSIKELKAKKLVEAAYAARSEVMQDVLKAVLHRHGFSPMDFQMVSPATDAVRFWSRLGLAIQQVLCIRGLEGDDEAYEKLKTHRDSTNLPPA